MSSHSNKNPQKSESRPKATSKRNTHNLSENMNSSSFTIQQYNNFINIDSYKNNININNSNSQVNDHLHVPKSKNLPLKTSPSPMKKDIKAKKTNYSTDRYVIDRPQTSLNSNNNMKMNKKDYSGLFKKLKSKISKNIFEKQMGKSFENVPSNSNLKTNNSSNLQSKISFITKKTEKRQSTGSTEKLGNSFIYNTLKTNDSTEVLQNLKKIESLLEGFILKNESSLQSENEILTVYITNLLEFLNEISGVDEHFKNLFKNLKFAIEMPISKMVEQFLRLRDFLVEQNDKLHENEKEIEYMKGQITILLKENEKMSKNQVMLNNFFSDRYEINEFGLDSLQEVIKENSRLKNLLKKQKESMVETRDKDSKIMKLLYAIRKKGIDIEEIYNEDVKTPEEISLMDENIQGNINMKKKKYEIAEEDDDEEISNSEDKYEIDPDESGVRNDIYKENSSIIYIKIYKNIMNSRCI